ncbi:MAG: peptide chain release factor N(5)-glutamine methyltransferase [Gammaproteobacteria bacterium]|nr:peptide chain release factor N(5)-glutamine methyltransferase [Gammaproteobacteria bacterium]MCH9743759.1 peptide chain release factor N(5)-glutamine methyltransferase [Gammaproteobacteria bacterium]
MSSIAELIKTSAQLLALYSDTPRLDAECLIANVINQPREYLYANREDHLSPHALRALQEWITRRQQGEPVAYILGKKEFWSLDLQVTTDTLIPRPETEHLIEWALENLPANKALTVADLGTGSGAIAIALAHERPNWTIHATDCSFASLKVAIKNAARFNLDNIEFYHGDWCEALPTQQYDVVISNPPYIESGDIHLHKLLFEPTHALASGTNGLDAIKKIMQQTQQYLNAQGVLMFEHGYNQAVAIRTLLEEHQYQNINHHQDLNLCDRFTTCEASLT